LLLICSILLERLFDEMRLKTLLIKKIMMSRKKIKPNVLVWFVFFFLNLTKPNQYHVYLAVRITFGLKSNQTTL